MSIIHAFDPDTEEILKASDVPADVGGPDREDFPEIAIMTFTHNAMRKVVEAFAPEQIGTMVQFDRIPIYRVEVPEGPEVAITRIGMGAPLAAALLEDMMARGARKFIIYGSCGALDPRLEEGLVLIPTEAYRDEGTSYHYKEAGDYITIRNAALVESVLKEQGVKTISGRIWTTDGLYRETRGNMEKRRAEGCLAVDMECAALQAVCDFRGCELYQFVYAEDSLAGEDGKWQPRNMGKITGDAIEGHLALALAIARRISD